MAYAVVTKHNSAESWEVLRVANTRATAEHAWASAATNQALQQTNAFQVTTALAHLHTVRHVGNIVDKRELTIIKSVLN